MNERMLAPEEVSDLLSIEQRTLRSWRQAGTGPPAIRMGKYVRYPAAELEKWIAERTSESRRGPESARAS